MPRGNGTGPMGQGPMTGRGLGFCAGYDMPGYTQPGFSGRGFGQGVWNAGFGRGGMRRGMGRGFGPGMGFRRGGFSSPGYYGWENPAYPDYPPFTEGDEKSVLTHQAEILKQQIDSIESRLSELEGHEDS